MNEDQLLLAQIKDKINSSMQQYTSEHTGFLDLHQQHLVQDLLRTEPKEEILFQLHGGYQDAQRQMFICRPSFIPCNIEEYIVLLRVTGGKGAKKLTHRDYLGALVGTGIERREVGDILVHEEGADILVTASISPFLQQELLSVGAVSIDREILPLDRLRIPKQQVKTMNITVSSPRIDSLVAAIFGISRAASQEAVRAGRVFIDSREVTKAEQILTQNQIVVLRGKGKAKIISISEKPKKKGRIPITVEKYM